MTKKKQTINKSLFIVPIISGMLLIWYYATNSVFEKIFIIFVLFSTVLPLGFGMMNIMIYSAIPSNKGSHKKKKYVPKNRNAEYICRQLDKKKTTRKPKAEPNPYYLELRSSIINLNRQGKLTEYIIKNLKSEIDILVLEDYSNFRFNDVKHEIYTKIKDSALTNDDYIYLNGYLIGLINNDIAYKEITNKPTIV